MKLRTLPRDGDLKFARTLHRKRKAKLDPTPESTIQEFTEAYLVLRNIPFIRIPDSVYAAVFGFGRNGASYGASEYLKGLPDLTILYRGRYLALELKRDGGKLRASQRVWRDAIGTVVAHSFDEAQGIIDSFIKTVDFHKENAAGSADGSPCGEELIRPQQAETTKPQTTKEQ